MRTFVKRAGNLSPHTSVQEYILRATGHPPRKEKWAYNAELCRITTTLRFNEPMQFHQGEKLASKIALLLNALADQQNNLSVYSPEGQKIGSKHHVTTILDAYGKPYCLKITTTPASMSKNAHKEKLNYPQLDRERAFDHAQAIKLAVGKLGKLVVRHELGK